MTRYGSVLLAVVGVLAVIAGVAAGLAGLGGEAGPGGLALAILAGLVGLIVALWRLKGPVDAVPGATAPPWTERGALVGDAPERTASDPPVSGTELAERIDAAGAAARNADAVEEGLSEVRPALRAVLTDVLRRDGLSETEVETALAEGTWTDDREAAAVLDPAVDPPARTLRERFYVWLYPERIVRRQAGLAVRAIAERADGALPTIVGQDAPRTEPVRPPTVADLQRAADGTLRRAHEPLTGGLVEPDEESADGDAGPDAALDLSESEEPATDRGEDEATGASSSRGRTNIAGFPSRGEDREAGLSSRGSDAEVGDE